MQVIDPGHEYLLDCLDGGSPVKLTFVKRQGPNYPGNVGEHPGTIMQEVLRALIDRCQYVNGQIPCAETELAGSLLRTILYLFEARAAVRHGRLLAIQTAESLVGGPTCPVCGHIQCHGHTDP